MTLFTSTRHVVTAYSIERTNKLMLQPCDQPVFVVMVSMAVPVIVVLVSTVVRPIILTCFALLCFVGPIENVEKALVKR